MILRTAGVERSKPEIKRDYEYLLRLWEPIRDLTLQSTAPALIYEEGDLIKRSIRDLYATDIDEVLVEGEEGYQDAKDFMRMLMPSQAKQGRSSTTSRSAALPPLPGRSQFDAMHLADGAAALRRLHRHQPDRGAGRHRRQLGPLHQGAQHRGDRAQDQHRGGRRSRPPAAPARPRRPDRHRLHRHGGEAATTARSSARLKEALKHDRARIQVGRISPFGLLEMSRQRIRTSVLELRRKSARIAPAPATCARSPRSRCICCAPSRKC